MNFADIEKIKKFVRATNYLSVIQIYLQENFLLEDKLRFEHIKPRLLGHWGTCPGINFVYANLNYLIKKHNANLLFVLGTGHGFPALQSNLFLEGSLEKFYPEATHKLSGVEYIAKNFSWPYGFPSHSNPGAPGAILEGGELGYSLSTAYGAILDNPDLIVACLIGDGEAETGPLAASWQLNKFIDPKTNGIVLPILHLNGYKISGPTIFGRMSHIELVDYFQGLGYEPLFINNLSGEDLYKKAVEVFEIAYQKILKIKNEQTDNSIPRGPVIILQTPKGWTGPKIIDGNRIVDNHLSHQVVAPGAKNNKTHLEILEDWLKSYNFNDLYDSRRGFDKDILDLIPNDELKMGLNKHAYPAQVSKDLKLPDPSVASEEVLKPGAEGSSSMRRLGDFLKKVGAENPENFRIFSPDETYSNKIDKVFNSTKRAFVWPLRPWDKDMARDGNVIEMLSEHSLFGLLQGYILTGRHGLFISYEAFVQIVSSMADQYLKFMKIARSIPWRKDYSSLNIILTSSGWRQDHNGFSHQNPGFITSLVEKQDDHVKIFFPPDGNTTIACMQKSLQLKNGINVIVAGKTLEPRWFDIDKAKHLVSQKASEINFLSDENPNIVFVGIGDYVTKELIAAREILKKEIPNLKIKFISVIDLSILGHEDFSKLITKDLPVYINFHGYPDTIKKLLFHEENTKRIEVRGYIENGSTTTPYDMHIRNKTSRWHIIFWCIEKALELNLITSEKAKELNHIYTQKILEHKEYIIKNGIDLPEIENFDYTIENKS
jgi:xylulose-5-phosphate/fructose-6-phosphate phosphoketolase